MTTLTIKSYKNGTEVSSYVVAADKTPQVCVLVGMPLGARGTFKVPTEVVGILSGILGADFPPTLDHFAVCGK